MTVYKPAFLRPVEITTANDGFSIKLQEPGGLTNHALTLDNGVWGSVFNVASGIEEEIKAASTNWNCDISFVESGDDLKIKIILVDSGSSGVDPLATWGEVYDLIGATGAAEDDEAFVESPTHTYTATMTYRPSHMWIPTYQTAEQGRFYKRQSDLFRGNMSLSGNIGGNIAGPSIYWRDVLFVNEPAANLYETAATVDRHVVRCLEYFADKCRTSYPVVSGNPSTKGFYYFADWTYLQRSVSELTDDGGGINFDYATSPDKFVFCHLDIGGPPPFDPSLPTTRTRYSTGMSFHTIAYTPSWTYYSA